MSSDDGIGRYKLKGLGDYMNKRFGSVLKILAVAAALTASAAASAQSAGVWSVQVGAKKITPKTESGFLTAPTLPGVQNDVASDTEPVVTFDYMITDNIGLETYIAPPFKHDQLGAGSIKGTGKLGSVESLPATLLVQYRFLEPKARFRPYVGVGITYGYFQKETGSAQLTALTNTGSSTATTFKVESAWGSTVQVGGALAINDRWFIDLNVTKTYIKTTSRFSTGQTIDLKLDPVSVSLSVGYHF
jgi:outer membrane protein